ncbi:hypothetical protein FRC11_010396 [Ceratobasidium sp. 423]|nr:hypothetical protein FRC11_010396 [Ceratobasidium sp. 423]
MTATLLPAMKPHLSALMNALLKSTNPYELERPCYMLWNHILVSFSNFISNNHLWTTPEFPVVVRVGENETFDASFYDEDNQNDEDENENENTGDDEDETQEEVDSRILDPDFAPDGSLNSSFFEEAETLLQSSVPDITHKNAEGEAEPSSTPQQLPRKYALRRRVDSNDRDTSTRLRTHTKASNQADIQAHQGSRRRHARIADFAVNHLKLDDTSKKAKYLHFHLQDFDVVKVPIVIEGKRAPERGYTEDPENFQIQLTKFLRLAHKDFISKRRDFSSRSTLANRSLRLHSPAPIGLSPFVMLPLPL